MLKFSSFVYHYHQPPDAYNVKLLFNHFVRRGREFLEKVRNGGRHSATVPDLPAALPTVAPTVVCTTARSAVYWQKSAAAWKNLVSGYLARSQRGGFASKFAESCRSQWAFGSWRGTNSYRGLARKVAMFGFVGVVVSGNGKAQHLDLDICNSGNDNIYSTVHDMFTVEPKHSQSELPVSINSIDDLRLGEVIACDGCGAFFSATVNRQHPDASIDAVLVKDALELVNDQHQQLRELVHVAKTQNRQLRQIVSFAAASDDALISSVDNCSLTASVDCSGDIDEALSYIEKCIAEQCRQMMDVAVTACRQNAELKAACDRLHSPSKVSETVAKEIAVYGDVVDSDDDDDEGFVVISCDENDNSCGDAVDRDDDRFTTLISFANGHEMDTVGDQRETELTQLSKDKANSNFALSPDEKTSAKESVVDSRDATASVMVRVQVLPADDGLTRSTLSLINQQLMHVNMVWWSHPTEPPDKHWRRQTEFPAHFNIVETYAGFVTNVASVLAVGRHCDVLHGLPETFNVQRDFAVCTVMKPMKMTLAEFLSSHSIDIRWCNLLLLQLMEAVIHLGNYRVSCRNLKSGSIFVELINDEPRLVVADFGRRSPDEDTGHYEKRFSSKRCMKSDLSTVRVLASEILSACSHRSGHYTAAMSVAVRLFRNVLQTESQLTVDTVANALHVLLWAPQHCITALQSDTALPDSVTISWWLVHLAAVTYCCQRHSHDFKSQDVTCDTAVSRLPIVSDSLRRIFLSRVNLRSVIDAMALLKMCC